MMFRCIRFVVKCFMHIIFRIHVHNKENLPMEGACIVALNHKSLWDAPLVVTVLPRPLCFMAKKELFKNPILAGILRWSGAFPVARGTSDIGAIKTALSVLKADKALALFPEGRRVGENEAHTAKAGVALFAEKTGAPIVPVALGGKYRLFARLDVYVGEPIWVKSEDGSKLSGEQLQEISDRLMAFILQMAETGKGTKKEQNAWTLE
ncbi:MAG: 1-acyl-sn-glycerol-3-phosphate acyltransferase [Clostridia bacterium]|nr:1-acyl-sn-glycerol-3-phosphate acyltransferase [Clostridia bacterium]